MAYMDKEKEKLLVYCFYPAEINYSSPYFHAKKATNKKGYLTQFDEMTASDEYLWRNHIMPEFNLGHMHHHAPPLFQKEIN